MRKPRYQNEDIMKALGIKTEEERKKYNDALIDEAYLFVDDEVEGYYRCLWGLTTEEDDYKWRMCAKAYARREELKKTLYDRMILTKAEKRRHLRLDRHLKRKDRRMWRTLWRKADKMTDEEIEQGAYEADCLVAEYREEQKKREAEQSTEATA